MVRVRGWGMHSLNDSPHKYRSTSVCVCVCVGGVGCVR